MVSVLEGIRLKNGIVPCGHNFDPSGSSLTWHLCHTRMYVPCKFGVSAISPSEILSSSCCFFSKNEHFQILTPLIFGPPQNFTILKGLVILHPCTKFGEIRSKGVGARGHKAEKTGLCPAGTILTPRGHHLHGTSAIPGCIYPASLESLRPSNRKKCQAHVVFFVKNENFEILTPLIFGPPLISQYWKTLSHCTPVPNFGVSRCNGVGARGHKAEKRDCALRA